MGALSAPDRGPLLLAAALLPFACPLLGRSVTASFSAAEPLLFEAQA